MKWHSVVFLHHQGMPFPPVHFNELKLVFISAALREHRKLRRALRGSVCSSMVGMAAGCEYLSLPWCEPLQSWLRRAGKWSTKASRVASRVQLQATKLRTDLSLPYVRGGDIQNKVTHARQPLQESSQQRSTHDGHTVRSLHGPHITNVQAT